ncbi:TPA: hypothetical protein ACXI1D_003514, partial [Proteus mirabilis]
MVEHWLKDGKRCLEHTELTYDLAQRTLITVETGGETTFCRWNEQQQIIERSVSYGQTGEVFTAGHWYYHSYQYDPLGQLTAHLGSVQTEHFLYDAAANLLTRPHTEAPHNQV